MSRLSLEDILKASGNIVERLRNSQTAAYVYPVVPPEFTNWRDEQRAWREAAVLFDQSHYMAELAVEGPDSADLLAGLAVNSFANFQAGRAKHLVTCNHSGHVIGDVIAFRLADQRFLLVGRVPTIAWVQFHAETGGWKVRVARDDRSPVLPRGDGVQRKHYRFQVQGPNAPQILERVNGGTVPEIEFFHIGEFTIAGRKVPALRHGMAGGPGLEIWGPYQEGDEVRSALLEAGQDLGLRQCGSRAYATNTLESGWIPSPLPAVYSGDEMTAYRSWLTADSYEASGSIGGSFVSDRIEDYYLTPHELGYGFYVKFDHDFIGRAALEGMSGRPQRRKVTFEWNSEDVSRVFTSMLEPGSENYKCIDLPLSNYAASSYDRVMLGDRMVGFSMFAGYSYNERAMLSLGVVDPEIQTGDLLTLVWGEPEGGSRKTTVEPHRQTEIRVKVAPVPYAQPARESYAKGWRTRGS